jgi:predicted CxxxxCH...CXXCH cytochrome family protein
VLLDPMEEGKLRWPWDTDTPQQLLEPEKIARMFGETGIVALLILFVAGATSTVATEKKATMDAIWVPVGRIVVAPPVGVSPRRSAVAFPHSRHFNYRCKTCHHKWDGHTQVKSCSASNCHNGLSAQKKDSQTPFDRYYKTAFHQSCIGCHKEIKVQNQKLEASKTVLRDTLSRTGPTGCVQCHPKDS